MKNVAEEQKERERRMRETTMPHGEFSMMKTLWWNIIELDGVLQRLPLVRGGWLWDAGCSDGRLIERLRSSGRGDVVCVGTDFAVHPLRKMMAKQLDVLAACSDATYPLFREKTFDAVVSLGVVQQMASREQRLQMLRCLYAALKPGGRFVVTVLNRRAWAGMVANGIEGPLLTSPELFVYLYTPQELRQDLVEAGFQVRDIAVTNSLPVRYLKRLGWLGVAMDMFITGFLKPLALRKGQYLLAAGFRPSEREG